MIAKAMRGRAFSGLARYLEAGRDGNAPERVEWMEARNLPTVDPETASLLMRATAAQSDRVRRPVYHLALSFDPEDQVDRATMVRVADRPSSYAQRRRRPLHQLEPVLDPRSHTQRQPGRQEGLRVRLRPPYGGRDEPEGAEFRVQEVLPDQEDRNAPKSRATAPQLNHEGGTIA